MTRLRPPSHRGPLIAAGAVVLTVGVAVLRLRLEDEAGSGWPLGVAGAAAALCLWLAVQFPLEGGRPPAFQSVLLVCGLLLLFDALLGAGRRLGVPVAELPAGALEAVAAATLARRRNSAVCALIAALATGLAVLAGAHGLFDVRSAEVTRWLLLALAAGFVLTSLAVRAGRPRHAEQLVNAAGIATLLIAAGPLIGTARHLGVGVPASLLPTSWEVVVLAAGCGLLAYAAADRAPGPGYLGAANLAAFAAVAGAGGDGSVAWWPVLLLLLGLGVIATGLRPRRPLPPEPPPYSASDLPLAARSDPDRGARDRREGGPP